MKIMIMLPLDACRWDFKMLVNNNGEMLIVCLKSYRDHTNFFFIVLSFLKVYMISNSTQQTNQQIIIVFLYFF